MRSLHRKIILVFVLFLPRPASAVSFANLNSVAPAYYIPVTLTNSQTSPSAANLQVEITINSNANSTKYAANLVNVNWQDGNGNILPSWLESGENNASPTSVYWVNLGSNTMAAGGGALTVYQVLYATGSTAMDGTITGAEPNFTGVYGQYDSGAAVFAQYGGKSWSSFTNVGGTWNTTNGYLQQTATTGSFNGGPASLIESTNYAANGSYILEMAFNYTTQAVARVGIIAVATVSGGDSYGYRFVGQQSNNGAGFLSFLNDEIAWEESGTYAGAVGTNYTMQVQDNGGIWSGSLFSGYGVTGASLAAIPGEPVTYTANNDKGNGTGYVGISAGYYNGSTVLANPVNVQWFRMRNLPPKTVLPTVSAGAIVNFKNLGFQLIP